MDQAVAPGNLDFLVKAGARELTIGALDLVLQVSWQIIGTRKLRELAIILAYGNACGRMTRRVRRIMDIDTLVAQWLDVFVALSTSHEQQQHNSAEARTDDLLGPLLTAPIAQVRTFVQALARALEADARVPFLIWSSFARVIQPLVLKGPDGATIELKTTLALEIAELVEHDLNRAELIAAIAGALQWRTASTLQQVKAGLQAGTPPRIRGRESCLFLDVGEVTVML